MPLFKSYKFIVTIVSLSGITITILFSNLVHQQQIARVHADFEREVTNRHLALLRNLDSTLLIGHSIVGYYNSSIEVTRDEFSTFVKVYQGKIPFISAIEWIPRVADTKREQLEALAKQRYPDFTINELDENAQLIQAGQRQEYFPVYYVEPYQGNEQALGFDLASSPSRWKALELARDLGSPVTTSRIKPIQIKNSEANNWGFLVIFPVYANAQPHETVVDRQTHLHGFIAIVFDMKRFIESSFQYLKPAGINISAYDDSAPSGSLALYYHVSRTSNSGSGITAQTGDNPGNLQEVKTLAFNNRIWSIKYESTPGYYETSISPVTIMVFIAGLIITLLLIYILRLSYKHAAFLQTDKELLEKLVAERTRELEYRNRDLESYSYSIAHDLRTPLRSITSFSQILHDDLHDKLEHDYQHYLQRIINAGKKMAQLIDDILKISRISRHKIELKKVDLSSIAMEQVNYLRTLEKEEHRTPVDWRIQSPLVCECDPSLLTISLENLLGNAYKFTAQTPQPVIEFGLTTIQGQQVYFVRDNGVGFEMQYAAKVFNMFERLHDDSKFIGTGIGLATVKRAIELHGGFVWAESEPGKVTTFYFTLTPTQP